MKKVLPLFCFQIILTSLSLGQPKILKGIVINEKENPVKGASIVLYYNNGYTRVGTSTDTNGRYSLEIPNYFKDSISILCTHIGYKNEFEKIEGNDSINFKLTLNNTRKFEFVKEQTTETKIREIYRKPNKKVSTQLKKTKDPILQEPEPKVEEEEKIFTKVEINASYYGGENALKKYFENSIIYPDSATIKNVDGIVTVGFTIDKRGKATNLKLIKGVNKFANESVLNAIEKMPDWSPAIQNGYYTEEYFEFSFNLKIKNLTNVIKDYSF